MRFDPFLLLDIHLYGQKSRVCVQCVIDTISISIVCYEKRRKLAVFVHILY